MDINSKIYVSGHSGMVGSAIIRELKKQEFTNIIYRSHTSLDLTNQREVTKFFKSEKPNYVFLSAAKVGGIQANNIYRAQFLYENLMIQSNVINAAHEVGVKKLMFLGSACIYPRNSTQPIKEEYLLTDTLESTNEPYAIAKIAGIKLCENYYHQYGNDFLSVMPNNLYGPNDNFDLETSHVLPALMRKFHVAKKNKIDKVEIWGTGKPLREFLHVDDMAEASVFVMNLDNDIVQQETSPMLSHINVGTGVGIAIKDLALIIKKLVNYRGDFIFNTSKPDGTMSKVIDVKKINSFGWKYKVPLDEGIKILYDWYLKELNT